MSLWAERVKTHGVWDVMNGLGRSIDQAVRREDAEPVAIDGLERVRAVLAFTGKRLAGAEPHLVHLAPLDAINGSLQSVASEVAGYIADGESSHITSANSHADQVLATVPQLNYSFVSDDWNAARDAAVAYRETLAGQLQSARREVSGLDSEAGDLRQKLSDLTEAVTAETAKAAGVATALQTTFDSAEATRSEESKNRIKRAVEAFEAEIASTKGRLEELSTAIDAERTRLTTLATECQGQFSTAQTDRQRDFTEAQKTQQGQVDTVVADYTKKLSDQDAAFTESRSTLTKTYESNATATLDTIERHKKSVEKLVGVIGNLGVTSGYVRTANEAWWSIIVWQVIAVAAMITVIVFAYKAFLPLTDTTFTWPSFAGKLVLTVAIGALAAYAAAQADRQQGVERRNRKRALELQAIGPFLAPLPEKEQHAFIVSLGDRTFGHEEIEGPARGGEPPPSPANVVQALVTSEKFQEILAEAVKTATLNRS